MDGLMEWLCEGSPWVEYRTRLDLLDQAESDPIVLSARQAMMEHQKIKGLITELSEWPGQIVTSHKKADLLMHKLVFLADLGVKATDPGMDRVIRKVLEYQSKEGPFQVMMNISPAIGGTGKDQLAWALCDSPLIIYALIKMGLDKNEQVKAALDALVGKVQENGWPCVVSPEMGRFRGPGRKEDPCPFATLIMLQVLNTLPDWKGSRESDLAAKSLLALWGNREQAHPYIFYMGTDFCKLKAPFIWYDILHVSEVLSQIPELREDPGLMEMVKIVQSKKDLENRYIPESVWLAWKDWDFGQKKLPSQWLTFLVCRLTRRMGMGN